MMPHDVVGRAEDIVNKLERRGNRISLTTSQIRKFLAAVNAIQNRVEVWKSRQLQQGKPADELPDGLVQEIKFLKVKLIYQAGREGQRGPTKNFIDKSHILDDIDAIGGDTRRFEEFSRLMEAIVAYHKFNGGGN